MDKTTQPEKAIRDKEEIWDKEKPHLWTMPASADFLTSLTSELLRHYSDQPQQLARITIFLPTRRATRALSRAFSKQHPDPILLPVMRTLSDIDTLDLLDIEALVPFDQLPADLKAPQTPTMVRQFWIAHLARAYLEKNHPDGHAPSWPLALNAADSLTHLLDAMLAEEIDPDKVKDIVPEEYAAHWQNNLKFLEIILQQWPLERARLGTIDPAQKRSALLNTLADIWQKKPPQNPIIIAGSTGSLPAVAHLMRVVAEMPQGHVILPGLDTRMEVSEWNQLDDPHPQMGMKHLLEKYFPEIERQKIPNWPHETKKQKASFSREELIRLALQPANSTDGWHRQINHLRQQPSLEQAIKGLHIATLADEDSEAEAIALLMRECAQEKTKTCHLITPNRLLAKRVSEKLRRWDIHIDDSAGVTLGASLRGEFLQLVANWLPNPSDPVALMALLHHKLFTGGLDAAPLSLARDQIDFALRGFRPGEGFTALEERLRYGFLWLSWDDDPQPFWQQKREKRWQQMAPLVSALKTAYQMWHQQFARDKAIDSARLLQAHLDCAQYLSTTETAEAPIWMERDGEAIAQIAQDFLDLPNLQPRLSARDYPHFFAALLENQQLYQTGLTHPRLTILGPLEARLLQADRVILGGLNEGTWPSSGTQDPFLSRPMRDILTLPSPERRIGLAAHDFAQSCAAPEIYLTRSQRAERAPTTPSRWLLRLQNILQGLGLYHQVDQSKKLMAWRDALYTVPPAEQVQISRPTPKPAVHLRPRKLSITRVETLIRDPYSIFARYILHLAPLDPLDAKADASLRGTLLHAILAEAIDKYFDAPAEDLRERLQEILDRRLTEGHFPEWLQALWRSRMEKSFAWFASFHADQRQHYPKTLLEHKGELTLDDFPAGPFTLTAKADRIDFNEKGHSAIIDYKSGTVPSGKVARLFNPQLQLTALILLNGGFKNLTPKQIDRLALIKIWNRKEDDKDDLIFEDDDLSHLIEDAQKHALDHLRAYDAEKIPYLSQPRAQFLNRFGDYDHLARRGEWASQGGED